MAELLKMPELTQEQLEAALIIKGILDRFDAETKARCWISSKLV